MKHRCRLRVYIYIHERRESARARRLLINLAIRAAGIINRAPPLTRQLERARLCDVADLSRLPNPDDLFMLIRRQLSVSWHPVMSTSSRRLRASYLRRFDV